MSLCSSAFAHSFHLRSFPTFPSAVLPAAFCFAACCVLPLSLFFLHIPTRKIHRARWDDVGIKTPATHFVSHKLNSLRPVCVSCPTSTACPVPLRSSPAFVKQHTHKHRHAQARTNTHAQARTRTGVRQQEARSEF